MYKILTKYTSTSNGVFWKSYMTIDENDTEIEFATEDIDVLKIEIEKLDKEIGYSNIRVYKDITYDVDVDITVFDSIENISIVTSEDINNIYDTAYNKVFGE